MGAKLVQTNAIWCYDSSNDILTCYGISLQSLHSKKSRVYLDDGAIYGLMMKHVQHLAQILETCRQNNANFNVEIFFFPLFLKSHFGLHCVQTKKITKQNKTKQTQDILSLLAPQDQKVGSTFVKIGTI